MSSKKKAKKSGTQALGHEGTKEKAKPSLVERVAEALIGVEVPLVLTLVRRKEEIYEGYSYGKPRSPKRYKHSVDLVLREVWDKERSKRETYQRPAEIHFPLARLAHPDGHVGAALFDMIAGTLGTDSLLDVLAAVREDPKPEPKAAPPAADKKKAVAKPQTRTQVSSKGPVGADGLTASERKNQKRKEKRAGKKHDAGTRGPGDAASEASFREEEHAHGQRPASKSGPTEKEIADVAEFFGEGQRATG